MSIFTGPVQGDDTGVFTLLSSKIVSTNCNPSLYGVFCLIRNYVPRKITENPKSRAKSSLSTSAAER